MRESLVFALNFLKLQGLLILKHSGRIYPKFEKLQSLKIFVTAGGVGGVVLPVFEAASTLLLGIYYARESLL